MPSPCPGMDPYLEGALWQEWHERLANQISVHLMPRLGLKYVALLTQHYVIDRPALTIIDVSLGIIYPDVLSGVDRGRIAEITRMKCVVAVGVWISSEMTVRPRSRRRRSRGIADARCGAREDNGFVRNHGVLLLCNASKSVLDSRRSAV